MIEPQITTASPRGGDVFEDPVVATLAEAIRVHDNANVRVLASRADLRACGDRNVTLLQWALLQRNADALGVLIEAGADPAQPGLDGDTVVHLATMAEDPVWLDTLLALSVNPNVVNAHTGAVPLCEALMNGRERQFHRLLATPGIDLDHADAGGNTPLHVAAMINAPARVLELLEAGADPGLRNRQGATFQRYLFKVRLDMMDVEGSRCWEDVLEWMVARQIPIDLH